LRGTIQSIDRSLRDRATGQVLGTAGYPGLFVFPIHFGLVNPLLDSGYQDVTLGFDSGPNRLGFAGQPAVLRTDVAIKDTAGRDWIASGEFDINVFPTPVVRSPVGVTVRQNDPRSKCAFDEHAGYGLLVDISWDALPDSYGVNDYVIGVTDGRGVQLISPFLAHSLGTPFYRFVDCGAY